MTECSDPSKQKRVNRRAFLKLSVFTGIGLASSLSGRHQKIRFDVSQASANSSERVLLTATDSLLGPQSLIQSKFRNPGNFEAVVRKNNDLIHYFHDNTNWSIPIQDKVPPWQRAQVITPASDWSWEYHSEQYRQPWQF